MCTRIQQERQNEYSEHALDWLVEFIDEYKGHNQKGIWWGPWILICRIYLVWQTV